MKVKTKIPRAIANGIFHSLIKRFKRSMFFPCFLQFIDIPRRLCYTEGTEGRGSSPLSLTLDNSRSDSVVSRSERLFFYLSVMYVSSSTISLSDQPTLFRYSINRLSVASLIISASILSSKLILSAISSPPQKFSSRKSKPKALHFATF